MFEVCPKRGLFSLYIKKYDPICEWKSFLKKKPKEPKNQKTKNGRYRTSAILKAQTVFLRSSFCKILTLCTVSIQERFQIKSRL